MTVCQSVAAASKLEKAIQMDRQMGEGAVLVPGDNAVDGVPEGTISGIRRVGVTDGEKEGDRWWS
jgi:hypothetical protein